MNLQRLATATLLASIAVATAQGFAFPQAVFCARDAIGNCAERYFSIFGGFMGASLCWAVVLAGLRWLSGRLSPAPRDRLLWVIFGSTALAILTLFAHTLPYREFIAVSSIPMIFIGTQESVWRFEPQREQRKPLIAGATWALLSGACAYLITTAILRWSSAAAQIWWSSTVRVNSPSDGLAGPAFSATVVVAFIAFLLKPASKSREPGDLLSTGVFLAGCAVFGFSVFLWVQHALPALFEDPLVRALASAFATPATLVLIGTLAGVTTFIGALAASRESTLESASLLFFGGPIVSIAADRLAREWLEVFGAYPFSNMEPHPTNLALLAASRALWTYPFIGYFIAVRARYRGRLSRWLPSVAGLTFSAFAVIGIWVLLHTEAYDYLRFYVDYFWLRELFALVAIPVLVAGSLFYWGRRPPKAVNSFHP